MQNTANEASTGTSEKQPPANKAGGNRSADEVGVLAVKHWSDTLFSFKVERPDSLRFRSGEFVMLGLMAEGANGKQRPLLRAYSIASPSWEEELEFYSIKVQDGPLTSRLQHLKVGDSIILKPRPVGTLIHDALLPGKRLWLLSTGTGIAPFASVIRDPETYEKFDTVVLMQTCRGVAELEYGKSLVNETKQHEILSEMVDGKLIYYPATTRETSENMGRITDNLKSDEFFSQQQLGKLNPEHDRCMICGSMDFNVDIQKQLEEAGFVEGSGSEPGSYVVEKAFVG